MSAKKVQIKNPSDWSKLGNILNAFMNSNREFSIVIVKFNDLKRQVLYLYNELFTKFADRYKLTALHDLVTVAVEDFNGIQWPADAQCNDELSLQMGQNLTNDHRLKMDKVYSSLINNAFIGLVMHFAGHFAAFKDQLLETGPDPENPIKRAKTLTSQEIASIGDAMIADHAFTSIFDLEINYACLQVRENETIVKSILKDLKAVNLLPAINAMDPQAYNMARLNLVIFVRNCYVCLASISRIIVTPDLDPQILPTILEKNFSTKSADFQKRHRKALDVVRSSGELLKDRFHIYYRRYVISGDISTLIGGFITDAGSAENEKHREEIFALGNSYVRSAKEEARNKGNQEMIQMTNSIANILQKMNPTGSTSADLADF